MPLSMASIPSINSYQHESPNGRSDINTHLVYFQPKYVSFGILNLNPNLGSDDFFPKMSTRVSDTMRRGHVTYL